MMRQLREITVALAATMLAALTACGGGGNSGGGSGGSGSGGGGGSGSTPTATISGIAGKGLLLNAIVSFYSVTNGAAGTTPITTVRTDSKTGAFTATVSASGLVLVTVTTDSQTQMRDELSGTVVSAPSGLVLHTVLDSVTSVTQGIAISPLTEMAYQIATSASGGLTTANNDAAFTAVDDLFLGGAPALYTQSIDVSNYQKATVAQQALAKLSTALEVAANEDTATNASGTACGGSGYAANLDCALSGLGALIQNGTGSSPTLSGAAQYLSAAYTQIDDDDVQIDGGQSPSALGMNAATQAETSFQADLTTESPFPGYTSGGTPVANTKALFADLRTNVFDEAQALGHSSSSSTSDTLGLAPIAASIAQDVRANVSPAFTATSGAIVAMKTAVGLLTTGEQGPNVPISTDIDGPNQIGIDANGNLYVGSGGSANPAGDQASESGGVSDVALISPTGQTSLFADTSSYAPVYSDAGAPYYFGTFNGLAVASNGDLFLSYEGANASSNSNLFGELFELDPSGAKIDEVNGPSGLANPFVPDQMAFDGQGNLYVTDLDNGVIHEFVSAATGGLSAATVSTVATVPASDTYGLPCGVAVDGAGNVYFSDCLDAIYEATPSGTVTLIAGAPTTADPYTSSGGVVPGIPGFEGLSVDSAGNIYVAEFYNDTIAKITTAGVMSTVAGQAGVSGFQDGQGSAALFNEPLGVQVDAAGNLYVADFDNNAIRKIDASGNVTTLARGPLPAVTSTHGTYCNYNPTQLGTATNVAQCVYQVTGGSVLMTVTATGSGTYTVATQPLSTTQNPNLQPYQDPAIDGYLVSSTSAAVDGTLTLTGTIGSGVPTGTFSGPLYVDAAGGSLTASLSLGVGSGWNSTTDSGTITISGSLSNPQGGIGLQSATIGSDSSLTVQNIGPLLQGTKLSALKGSTSLQGASIQGTLDVQNVTTSAFVYGAKVTIGAPVADKSGKYEIPGNLTVTGSVAQVSSGGATPLFDGTIGVALQGISSYDGTQPISSTNYLTVVASVSGNLSLGGGRVLDLGAEFKGFTIGSPTPSLPESLTATYAYSTPTGTLALNATGTYDTTNGFSGTITNSSGVTVTLSKPMSGTLAGTATDGGQTTATISGSTIDYSDGTVESLY